VAGGSVALVVGLVGIVVPVLPTTPFLIVAAACYGRSSPRCYRWLVTNRVFGRHLQDYLRGRKVSWKVRAVTLFLLWAVISCTCFVFTKAFWLRALLLVVALAVTVHIVTLGEPRTRRWVGEVVTFAAYVAALVTAALVVRALDDWHPLAVLALGTLAATAVVFAVSALVDNSSIYDPYWSLQPAAIVGYYLGTAQNPPAARQLLVASLVALYALRLTSNFFRDWPGLSKEDFRYRDLRARTGRVYWPVSFFGIHLFPTLVVYLGCLPLYGVFAASAAGFGPLDVAGTLVVLSAIAVAFVADEELRRFRNQPQNRGKVMRGGLWAYARHPNYLAEVAFWWGLWLFALAAGVRWWWTAGGAVLITLLFTFVSVPMMEKRLLVTRPSYAQYQRATPALLPRLRRRRDMAPELLE